MEEWEAVSGRESGISKVQSSYRFLALEIGQSKGTLSPKMLIIQDDGPFWTPPKTQNFDPNKYKNQAQQDIDVFKGEELSPSGSPTQN